MNTFLLSLIIVLSGVFAGCNNTEAKMNPVSTNSENVAIKGFDTVAYFAADGAAKGKPEFEFVWTGAKWHFSNAENLEKFKQNPEQYAPQFGGYCSWAVSHGYTADSDPEAWKIVDNKLYLNYNKRIKEKWEAEQQGLIQTGEKNWKEFETKKPEHK